MDDFGKELQIALAGLIAKMAELLAISEPKLLEQAVSQLPEEARAEYEAHTPRQVLGAVQQAEEGIDEALQKLRGQLPHGSLPRPDFSAD